MSGKSYLSRFRCPDTDFAVSGALNGVVLSPFYSESDWTGEWTPPQPQSPSGAEENWFKSSGLLSFNNATAGTDGNFEAANKLFNWEVATALDLRNYRGSFTLFCCFALNSDYYTGPIWRQSEELSLAIIDRETLSIALPFTTESGSGCAVAENVKVEPIPAGKLLSCALTWDNTAKVFCIYFNNRKIAETTLPEAAGISKELSSSRLTLGGGGDLSIYHWSMFNAALSTDALAALNCGLH